VRGSQTSSLLIASYLLYLATYSVVKSAKSNEKAERQKVVPTLQTKLKIIADFEAGKQTADIRYEHGILSTILRTVADKQKYKYVSKLVVPGTIKCLRTRENVLLKIEKLLLILDFCISMVCTLRPVLLG
jgi:hypothetical protein